jgi:hypothetical protein
MWSIIIHVGRQWRSGKVFPGSDQLVWFYIDDMSPFLPGAVFTEAKSGINDPGLNQRRQFCPDFQFVWTKWSRWRKLLSHWLLWRTGLWFKPIVSDFLHCRKLFRNSTNFQQKILDYLISIISSRSFPHCEYRLRARILKNLVEAEKPTFRGKLSFQRSECTAGLTVATSFCFDCENYFL